MRLVCVESPYAAPTKIGIERNVTYARACLADCLQRGEAPIASHLLYTQPGVLRDEVPGERALGIEAGLLWGEKADATVVYTDMGTSRGVEAGVQRAITSGRPVEARSLGRPVLRTIFKHEVCEATKAHDACTGCFRCLDCEYCKCAQQKARGLV